MKPRPIGPVSLGVPAARAAGSLRLSRRLRRGRMARVKASVTGSTGGRAEGSVRSVTGPTGGLGFGQLPERRTVEPKARLGQSPERRTVEPKARFGQLTKRLSIITREPQAPRAKGGKSFSSETLPQALHASREAAGKWRTERELKTRRQPLGPLARPSPRVALTLI